MKTTCASNHELIQHDARSVHISPSCWYTSSSVESILDSRYNDEKKEANNEHLQVLHTKFSHCK